MNPTILGNFCVQAKFRSVLSGPLQNLSLYMTTCNPFNCIATCMRYGEKTVFPFADDICELVLHRCRSDRVEDKKFSGKKDFKMCKGGLNIRHAMLRSHIAANSAVFNLSKATPLVLMTIEDPNYQPIMEELCSTERYIDAEIVHRKMIADRLLNGHSSIRDFLQLKLKMKRVLTNENEQSIVEFPKHSNKRNMFKVEILQLLAYRISRTKRLIGRDFSSLSKRSKFSTMQVIKCAGKAAESALTISGRRASLSKPIKSMLLNRVMKKRNYCKPNNDQN